MARRFLVLSNARGNGCATYPNSLCGRYLAALRHFRGRFNIYDATVVNGVDNGRTKYAQFGMEFRFSEQKVSGVSNGDKVP